jgi:hypothetical protein
MNALQDLLTDLFTFPYSVTMFALSLGRSTLLRTAKQAPAQRCFASSISDAVASLKGQHFMSIDQLS